MGDSIEVAKMMPMDNKIMPNDNQSCTGNACLPYMPSNPMLAFAYIPFQCLNKVYSAEEALKNGTLFPELNQPIYYPKCFQEMC